MEQSYAEAVHRMIQGGKTPKVALAALQETLKRSGRTTLFPRILRALKRITERERGRDQLTLSVPGAHATRAKTQAKHILSEMNIDMKDVETKEDDTLIGGWRLEGREHLYDVSHKKYLLELYKRATSS